MIVFATVVNDPFFVAVVVGLPTLILGFLGYRGTVKRDVVAAQTAITSSQDNSVQRVIDGLDRMVDNLQTDNREVRAVASRLARNLAECEATRDEFQRLLK